jgi:hypothetical protein
LSDLQILQGRTRFVSAYLRTHAPGALEEEVTPSQILARCNCFTSAYFRSYKTHALKETVAGTFPGSAQPRSNITPMYSSRDTCTKKKLKKTALCSLSTTQNGFCDLFTMTGWIGNACCFAVVVCGRICSNSHTSYALVCGDM